MFARALVLLGCLTSLCAMVLMEVSFDLALHQVCSPMNSGRWARTGFASPAGGVVTPPPAATAAGERYGVHGVPHGGGVPEGPAPPVAPVPQHPGQRRRRHRPARAPRSPDPAPLGDRSPRSGPTPGGPAPMRTAFLEFKDYHGWATFETTNLERTHILCACVGPPDSPSSPRAAAGTTCSGSTGGRCCGRTRPH